MSKVVKSYLCQTVLDKTEIALNKKLIGRQVKRFYCKSCLADYLDITVEELLDMVEDFKMQGCTLFE